MLFAMDVMLAIQCQLLTFLHKGQLIWFIAAEEVGFCGIAISVCPSGQVWLGEYFNNWQLSQVIMLSEQAADLQIELSVIRIVWA